MRRHKAFNSTQAYLEDTPMPISRLSPAELRLTIVPEALDFADTSELLDQPLPWIGQERAEKAARFGLGMDQPDYNLFVLGEVGSGRASLLREAMRTEAAHRPACATCTTSMRRNGRARCACPPARDASCASSWRR